VHVLVVDDDADLREALCQILEDAGHATYGVGTGTEALTRLAAGHHASVLVVDLNLPDMPGETLVERIRAEPRHANSTIVVATGSSRRVPVLGCDAMLRKPFDVDRLLDLIGACDTKAQPL
jgi:CheY-like chemotaxis protein